jgi:competence protein ComEC
MNITIIAAIFMSFFRRILGTRKGLIVAGIGIFTYTILVGGDAAVVRAAIMGALTLLALRLGRQTYGFASLSAAATIMTAIDPNVLWDVGFQLSFAATLGLMLFTPPLERWFTRFAASFLSLEHATNLTKPVSEFALYTIAAQLMTLPLSVAYFQQLSLTSFIANPVILPAQPLLMITGGIATIAGMIWIPLGRILAMLAWPFPSFTIWAVSQFAQSPLGNFRMGNSGPVFALIWYLLLILVILFIYAPKEKRPRLQLPSISTSTSVVALLILLLLITRSINDRPDGKLHITIVDVGMGDAALIQSPSGRYILIDGGPSSITLSDSLGRRLPLFTRVVDWLILTGTKEDQLGGLVEVIPRFPPASVLIAGPPRTGAYRYLVDHMTTESIPISQSKTGQSFDLTEGCKIEVINRNDQGATLLISFGNFRLLYAPSADPSSIEKWSNLASLQSVTAVLLPDGGSDLVSTSEWLAEIDPRLVLISVGAGNTRGLPSEPVLRALEGRRILRTDLNGTIDITTDGERMWVEVERTIHN